MNEPRKILVIRNDKLGDFMLAWPAFALLKKQYPDCRITALVPEYTRPIAEQCPWIDHVIIDKKLTSTISAIKYLATEIRKSQFDISISLFSELRTAVALWLAAVPQRIAPATKIAQLLYTHTLKQRRSKSEKPEYEYNIDLIKHFIRMSGDQPVTLPSPPYLTFQNELIKHIKTEYRNQHHIDKNSKLIIIHPGSGGSAVNLTLQQYADLATQIASQHNVHIIITAGPDELTTASSLARLINTVPHTIYHSTAGIVEFSKFIAICDLFISGSTGPLHIAGALNVATAAFYPARRSATSLRWQTLNDEKKRIAFMPKKYAGETDLQSIDLGNCAKQISELFKLA